MIIHLKCPACGNVFDYDDTVAKMFCPHCGQKVAYVGHKNPVAPAPMPAASPAMPNASGNLIINYTSSHPNVLLVTRIPVTGQKDICTGGRSLSYQLPIGSHKIVLKIGKINYNRLIVINSLRDVVVVNCGYAGRAFINIEEHRA